MKVFFSMIKRWDIIIIFLLILVSFLPLSIFSILQAEKNDGDKVAVITVDNKEVSRITLTGHTGTELLNIPEIECNTNTVELVDDKIAIKKSTCPEQICVNRGYISEPGIPIVCLPHKVIIEIETINEYVDEVIVSS